MDSRGSKITDFAHISPLSEGPWLPLTSLKFPKQLQNGSPRNPLKFDTFYSTASIMKLAKERWLQIKSQKNGFFMAQFLDHKVSEDLELAHLLQAAADKVANQEWFHAEKLLKLCNFSASKNGNPVQRVVYYFAKALQARIGVESLDIVMKAVDLRQAEIHFKPEMMKCQQEVPLLIVTQSVAIQAILDAVEASRRIHLVDFGINNGSHWILIMQNLALRHECPVELLKISAVGTSKEMLEVTGNQLKSFAESVNLPFSYLTVVSELKDLNVRLFDLDNNGGNEVEALAVYSEHRLSTQLAWPHHLDAILGFVRMLNPRIVVVKEMEARMNTNSFQDRFDEALVMFSALFDSMKVCMEHWIAFRTWSEEVVYQEMIQDTVAREGAQRVIRQERIGFWRDLFAKFGMLEAGFSNSCISQGSMLLQRSSKFSYSTLNMDGNSLIFGWNGTSIVSLSAWKFYINNLVK